MKLDDEKISTSVETGKYFENSTFITPHLFVTRKHLI